MFYREYTPHSALRPFVECFWTLDDNARSGSFEAVVPDGCIELLIHLGDRFHQRAGDDLVVQPRSFVFGQIERPLYLAPSGRTSIVAARFHPGGAYPFLGCDAVDLAGAAVPLDALWGAAGRRLEARLREAAGQTTRVALLASTMIGRPARAPTTDSMIDEAVRAILNNRGTGDIERLCRSLAMGRRQLERRFRVRVGLGPKRFARIVRFQNALRHVESRPDLSWTELALACGFYDQSHFIREFKAFAGQSPTRYATAHHELNDRLHSADRLDQRFAR